MCAYTTSSPTRWRPLGSELNSTFVKSRSSDWLTSTSVAYWGGMRTWVSLEHPIYDVSLRGMERAMEDGDWEKN